MFRALVFLSLLTSVSAIASPISMGAAVETKMQHEVNPNYVQGKNVGAVFAKARLGKMGALIEVSQEGRQSSSGGLTVQSQSTSVGLWGRYEFREPGQWSPFVGAGIGHHFDDVKTSFAGTVDRRRGQRRSMGIGAGISKVFWKYALLEIEGRANSMQYRDDVFLSALLRAGIQF